MGEMTEEDCWELEQGFVVGEIQVSSKMSISLVECGDNVIIIVLLVPFGIYPVYCWCDLAVCF